MGDLLEDEKLARALEAMGARSEHGGSDYGGSQAGDEADLGTHLTSLEQFNDEYDKLSRALRRSIASEKDHLREVRELKTQLVHHASALHIANRLRQQDERTMSQLRKEVQRAWRAADMSAQKEKAASLLIAELREELQLLRKQTAAAKLSNPVLADPKVFQSTSGSGPGPQPSQSQSSLVSGGSVASGSCSASASSPPAKPSPAASLTLPEPLLPVNINEVLEHAEQTLGRPLSAFEQWKVENGVWAPEHTHGHGHSHGHGEAEAEVERPRLNHRFSATPTHFYSPTAAAMSASLAAGTAMAGSPARSLRAASPSPSPSGSPSREQARGWGAWSTPVGNAALEHERGAEWDSDMAAILDGETPPSALERAERERPPQMLASSSSAGTLGGRGSPSGGPSPGVSVGRASPGGAGRASPGGRRRAPPVSSLKGMSPIGRR